ncbi:ribonuclease E/G [Nonomuraea candida]|uniref:ribonuclease E/G n=1 Tax=Nonomuraea candida TaxID=359159 RepID=UPI000A4D7A1C|nr:ribonuclease E/G [Nonomuraea candida]
MTVAAAQAAPQVAEVQPVQRTAAQRAAGEPAPELEEGSPAEAAMAEAVAETAAEKPKRATRTRSTATTTRRRTTKKAAEAQEAAGALPEGTAAEAGATGAEPVTGPVEPAQTVSGTAEPAQPVTGPVEPAATAQPVTGPAEPGAEAAQPVTGPAEPGAEAAEVVEAPVKRRRTRKKAEEAPAPVAEVRSVEDSAARAGAPVAVPAEGAEVAAPSGGGEAAAPFGDETGIATEPAARRTTRRRVRGAAADAVTQAGQDDAAAQAGEAPVTRSRKTRARGGEAPAAQAGETPAAQTGDALAGPVGGTPAGSAEEAPARASEVPAAAGAGTVTAGVAAGDEGVGEGVGEDVGEDAIGSEDLGVDEDILEILPEDEPLDDEPAGEDLDEENDRPSLLADPFGLSARRQSEPGTAFQRPAAIFAPLFQAPDPSQAKPAAVRRAEPLPVAEPEEAEEAEEPVDETVSEDESDLDTSDEQEEEGGGRRRRRRRGGRGRGKARERDESDEGEESEDEGDEEQAEEGQEEEVSSSRRRRRRRRRGTEEGTEPAGDDPPNTVVRIRAPRSGRTTALDTASDGVQSVRGSTRLEAKKQRRREGRELGRRRPPIITESEFLARRESVDRMMVVRRQGDRTQIAVLEDGVLVEHYVNREASQSYVGNVYLGKVQNVLPSMEAAFVDIGKGRNAVLYAGEVNFDTVGMEGQPKRIESALKSGQSVLVQVTKDPIGHKGARLTSQISLPGRYLVYVPDGSMTGISRKLPDKERTRLKSILKKVMPENAGVIVRTAAEGASEEELARDVARLSAQWENIQKKAKSASPPELLSAEPDLTIRVVRDVFNEDFTNLVVQGDDAWDTVDEYVKYVAPHLAERLSKWDGEQGDVFESYRIDEQLAKALERKVWLPSGGSLVIDRTEAMTVVDVNTGKFTGQGGNLEETVTRNNLEAAEEIVRQLRLRDIGGIIVIDFIDMVLESNRDLVLRRLLECLARDRTKHQVAEVTSLGLVQMTRKRVGQGLLEAFSTPCECCNGRGLLVSTEPVESKPEPRGTQGKMAVEKAVSDKVSAAKDSAGRDTVTGALEDVPAEDDQASQTSGRGRRRSRRAKSAE